MGSDWLRVDETDFVGAVGGGSIDAWLLARVQGKTYLRAGVFGCAFFVYLNRKVKRNYCYFFNYMLKDESFYKFRVYKLDWMLGTWTRS